MGAFNLSLREETVGVVPPPPGVTANFINPPSLARITLIVNIVLTSISAAFVILRLYTTGLILRSVGVTDYMIVLAWFLGCASSVVTISLIRYGLGRHLWDVPFSTFNGKFFKFVAIGVACYGFSIMFSKLSILLLFLRTWPQKPKKTIYATIAIVVLYSFISALGWSFACRPVEKFWDLNIKHGSCIRWANINIFSGVMNTLTDVVILLLPICMLRKVQLPKWEKIGLGFVLMTGGFVVIISIIRLKATVEIFRSRDFTWEYVDHGIWWMIEMHIAIVCACLPVARAFLRKHFTSLVGYNFNTFSNS